VDGQDTLLEYRGGFSWLKPTQGDLGSQLNRQWEAASSCRDEQSGCSGGQKTPIGTDA